MVHSFNTAFNVSAGLDSGVLNLMPESQKMYTQEKMRLWFTGL